jgi:hypothetical protein
MRSAVHLLLAGVLLTARASAQVAGGLGKPPEEPFRYVDLESILSGFDLYRGARVRTSGRLDLHPSGRFQLRSEEGNALDIVAAESLQAEFTPRARLSLGRQCEVAGYLEQPSAFGGSGAAMGTLLTLHFRSYTIAEQGNQTTMEPSPRAPGREPPTPAATPAPLPRAKTPPVVVFTMPPEGDTELPADERLAVHFSKDMDGATFEGRVFLRNAEPPQPGDTWLALAFVSYDEARRALVVDTRGLLRGERSFELVLRSGITDIEGLPLVPRRGAVAKGVVEVLRYRIR